ncbi:MAG: hypothetical protein ABI175_30675 [Polyangiales bacterium]
MASARGTKLELGATQPPASYDPFALARKSIGHASNEEASTPPQCYAKAEGTANTCASCHTRSAAPNFADDWELQQNYSFTEYAKTNRWKNMFRERSDKVAAFSDAAVLAHVRQDNYGPLRTWLAAHPEAPGFTPDIDLARGFDADGFAVDGSGWRAVRYKPFVGSFWATNGSTDDVFVRLPAEFRTSPAIYRANLAILEAAITADPTKPPAELSRTVEPTDETAVGFDLDGDGALGTATKVTGMPAHFAGGAASIPVVRGLYPAGTEFLHTVRYLDPERPGFMATRMKELRYAKKTAFLTERQIAKAYMAAEEPNAALFTGDALTGLTNGFSWQLHGFIEDANGWLRKQTDEEHTYCMGCHSNVGITVDQTFAFARKVPGAAGWRLQDPTGIRDVPQAGHAAGEYAEYLMHAGGGDDLRANEEVAAKFLRSGAMADERAAAMLDADIGGLVTPSAKRAIALDRAYLANVMEQSYVWGRDASTSPAKNVVAQIGRERSTGLGEADRVYRDVRLQLDWSKH